VRRGTLLREGHFAIGYGELAQVRHRGEPLQQSRDFLGGPPPATIWPEVILLGYLKRFRKVELDISQEEAARLLGISKNTWIRWEQGDKYDKICWLRKTHPRPAPRCAIPPNGIGRSSMGMFASAMNANSWSSIWQQS
jgi:hypothetical protein